jgi:hypothetical protein
MSSYGKFDSGDLQGNYSRVFTSEQYFKRLITDIQKVLNRKLSDSEKMYTIQYIQRQDPVIFANDPNTIHKTITNYLVNKISMYDCNTDDTFDIHEQLKREIGATADADASVVATAPVANPSDVTSILGISTLSGLQAAFMPATSSSKKTAYLFLDSRYRVQNNSTGNTFQWNYVDNNNLSQGSVNSNNNIQNIIAMRTRSIKLPYNVTADNPYNRLTMFIQEFTSQSFIAHENTNFHFIFETTVHDKYIDLNIRRDGESVYVFTTPISSLNTITLSFASPLQNVTLDPDSAVIQATGYGIPAGIQFTTPSPHNLGAGDTVYISGFTTTNPINDINAISAINYVNGIQVFIVDPMNFTIPVNTTTIYGQGPGTVSVTNGALNIVGVGTTFLNTFNVNDSINILEVQYLIASITDQFNLTLAYAYAGNTNTGLTYYKDNRVGTLLCSVYYASKRFFVSMEFDYLASS